MWFQKWHEELDELWLQHPKVWQLYIDGLFLSKAYTVSVRKISEELCVMTLKGVAKFQRKLTCGLKNDIRNLVDFHASSWKSENLHFDWIRLSKAHKYLDEKLQKRYVSWHWRVRQSLKKTDWSKNDMRNLVNVNVSSGKSVNLNFDVLILPIAHKVSA